MPNKKIRRKYNPECRNDLRESIKSCNLRMPYLDYLGFSSMINLCCWARELVISVFGKSVKVVLGLQIPKVKLIVSSVPLRILYL